MMIIGHRGAAAIEPENTLLSIERAIDLGVDAVEIDVHLSKDKELVVIHDATVDRTTNGTGPVSGFTAQEIKRLDAGKGQTIPTLQEAVDLINRRVLLLIELKEEGTEGPVVDIIKRNNLFDKACLISFFHRLVKTVKAMDSRIKTGVLFVGSPVDACIATQASSDTLVMKYSFVDEELVKTAHRQGIKVFIWNIDDRDLLKPYVDIGVDAIGTNDPRVLIKYLR